MNNILNPYIFKLWQEKPTREIYTKNLREVTRNFAQLCEIAPNYAYIFGINFPGYAQHGNDLVLQIFDNKHK